MSMAWVSGCRRHMCPKVHRRSLRNIIVSGGCPMRVRIGGIRDVGVAADISNTADGLL